MTMYTGRDVEENMKGGWGDLGVVETIFEDDDEDLQSMSSPPLSFPLSSPSSPLQSCVDAWTSASGRKPDVKIHVQGICFHLHKDPLISKSSYLQRQLITASEFTLSPQIKIAADTFTIVADFCYTGHAVITPFNVAPLRIAAELLEMEGDSGDGDESLREVTESYFCNVLLANREFTCKVFRACLASLPEAEQTAFMLSRCLETLFSSLDDGGDGDEGAGWADGFEAVGPEEFKVVVESMQRRYTRSHDLLYRVVDLYFLVYSGKMSEDQKAQICSSIDCSILSGALLMHAVQNPRMPLRFVVQAMLIEQLNTHRTIFSALNTATTAPRPKPQLDSEPESPATLGAILERDAALRQVAQLRAAIDTTCSRIQTLERELTGMKKLLGDQQEKEKQKTLLLLEDGGRSSSCRFSHDSSNNKVGRGERGSVSSSMIRFGGTNGHDKIVGSSAYCLESDHHESPRVMKKSFGRRLLRSLKNVFGASNKIKDGKLDKGEYKMNGYEKEDMILAQAFPTAFTALPHNRSSSIS